MPNRKSASVASSTRANRPSTELEQDFNSLDAQREAAEAYIRSQAHEGWTLVRTRYDDGGFSGGSTDRPALQQLLADIRDAKIDIVVVYKVDRLTRSLADFAKLVELFDLHGVLFVSVTQQFNTTSSMGRLTLNVLLSFAQFEREVTSDASETRLRRPNVRGSGSAAWYRWDIRRATASWWLSRRKPNASGQSLSAISNYQHRPPPRRPSQAKGSHQGPHAIQRKDNWRHTVYPRFIGPPAAQPVLHRRSRLQGRGVCWRAAANR